MSLFCLRCLWGVQKNERREKERERAPNGMRLIVDLWGKLDVVPFFIGCLVKLAGEMSNTMHVRAIEALFWSLKCRQHAVVLEFHETKLQQRWETCVGVHKRVPEFRFGSYTKMQDLVRYRGKQLLVRIPTSQ